MTVAEPSGRPGLDDGHLVAGEGPGLVGADERRRAEGLDRLEPPDEHAAASAMRCGPDGQGERDGGQQRPPARAPRSRRWRRGSRRRPGVPRSSDEPEERQPTPTAMKATIVRTTRSSSRRGGWVARCAAGRRQAGDAGQAGAGARRGHHAPRPRPPRRRCRRTAGRHRRPLVRTLSPVSMEVSTAGVGSASSEVGGDPVAGFEQDEVADDDGRSASTVAPGRSRAPSPDGQEVDAVARPHGRPAAPGRTRRPR